MTKKEIEYRKEEWKNYGTQYAKDHEKDFENWEFLDIIKLLRPKENEDILDIGCNTGEFCYLLKYIYHANPKGIDLNYDAVKIAEIKYSDISFYFKNLYELKEKEKYDAVTMIEIIEHLSEPEKALIKIRGMLKVNGRLIISTPNKWAYLHKFAYWVLGKKFLYDPTHVQEFSPRSIEHLLKDAGFEIEKVCTKKPMPLIGRISKNMEQKFPSFLFGGWLFCIARKK